MVGHIESVLPKLREGVEELHNAHSSALIEVDELLEEASDGLAEVGESWSGSPIGYHASLYYGNLERPPPEEMFDIEWGALHGLSPKWRDVPPKVFEELVEEAIGRPLEDIREQVAEVINDAEEMRESLCTELSAIRGDAAYENEIELLNALEEHKWGFSASEFVRLKIPSGQFVSRDSTAMSQGVRAPPHLQVWGQVASLRSGISQFEKFVGASRRLLRQLEIRALAASKTQITLNDVDKVLVVVRRFQTVARQLQARKKGREGQTIVLNDEYDVQDLLHGLLKMFFDDVRPEEWTPAYAGGAARMDFLLKKERTVVEVKKTRSGLGEKEVGDQLIQDIVKYGEHKDCGTLVCFVYDPEARIGNPRGLEADLSKMSTEKLTVIVVVAPG